MKFLFHSIRREAFSKGSQERSVQMDYMCHTSWTWCTPTRDSTILYAVLRYVYNLYIAEHSEHSEVCVYM